MDAVEFIKEHDRMCSEESCQDCKIFLTAGTCGLEDIPNDKLKELVSIVEQWSQGHPQKTIMQDFFEKFPNAPRTKTGEPMMCPYNCGYGNFCCEQSNGTCFNCWNRPLED